MAKKLKQHPINYAKQQRNQQRQAQVERIKQSEPHKCEAGAVNLQFTPMDTWFFRESRPHDAVGASELSSLFPPPVKTLLGAVRSFLGDSMGVNWKTIGSDNCEFKRLLGDANNLNPLSINGAWVCKNEQRLYPAPCYLMHKGDDFIRLQIGDMVECDLGKVRLPELPEGKVGYKALEQTWITAKGWEKLLNGETPIQDELFTTSDLFSKEARLGIARNNASRSVIEGKLYQTQHLRLKEYVTIQLDLKGLGEQLLAKLPQQGNEIVRLGGEGRMASLTARNQYEALPRLHNPSFKKFIIHFITAADFNGEMFPENFLKQEIDGQTVWKGEILGVELIIEAAVIGKVHREGGWDMQNHKPRAVKSYIPAGSAWFCRLDDESLTGKEVIEKLHGQCIGEEIEWGRGQILIGVWHDTAKTEEN